MVLPEEMEQALMDLPREGVSLAVEQVMHGEVLDKVQMEVITVALMLDMEVVAGGGWYGGGADNDAFGGGGGSGYVLTSSSSKPSGYALGSQYYLSNAATYAGNTSFVSPTGGTETGHSGRKLILPK